MSNLLDNINKGIAELHPYEPGRSIDEVVAEYKPDKVVKLASNENPLGPSPKAADICRKQIICIYIPMETLKNLNHLLQLMNY
jgi:histidinol-phosphate aminotransferase